MKNSMEVLEVVELNPVLFWVGTKYHGKEIATLTENHKLAKEYQKYKTDASYNKLRKLCVQQHKAMKINEQMQAMAKKIKEKLGPRS